MGKLMSNLTIRVTDHLNICIHVLRQDKVFAYHLNVLYGDVIHLVNRGLDSEQCLIGTFCYTCASVNQDFNHFNQ